MSDQPTTAIGQPRPVTNQPLAGVVRSTTAVDRLYDLPEAAKLTGLTVDALRKRASRGKLEHVKGNDGTVRVRLTAAALDAIHREAPSRSPDMSGLAELHERAAKAEGEAAVLRESLSRVQMQADASAATAEVRLEALNVALVQTAITEERTAAAVARAAAAEARLAAVETALAEARTPWMVRIVRAWRFRS